MEIIRRKKKKEKLFFEQDRNSPISEAFRVLRTNLYFVDKNKENDENRVILFTSSIPGEGKSTVAMNYAMSEAMNGTKVLLVDCDLRRPVVHRFFDIKNDIGLHSILNGDVKEDVAIKGVYKNLDVIPTRSINSNHSESLHSERLKEFLEKVKKNYGLIVLDAPPVTVVADPVILTKESDGVVVVCGYDMINRKQLEYTRKVLKRANANVYGVVVNKIDKRGYGVHGHYNDYHEYYHKYTRGD